MSLKQAPRVGLAAMCVQPVLTARARVIEALWHLDPRNPETTQRLEQALDRYGSFDPSPAAHDARA